MKESKFMYIQFVLLKDLLETLLLRVMKDYRKLFGS